MKIERKHFGINILLSGTTISPKAWSVGDRIESKPQNLCQSKTQQTPTIQFLLFAYINKQTCVSEKNPEKFKHRERWVGY